MSDIVYRSVAQVFSKRRDYILRDIEAMRLGITEPMWSERRLVGKDKRVKDRPLMPGYVFFETTENWGDVCAIEGVIRVLGNGQRLTDAEMYRLTVKPMTGEYNVVAPSQPVAGAVQPTERRKPYRPSKKLNRKRPGKWGRGKLALEVAG